MIYVDTSALVKRYIREPGSDPFDTFFLSRAPLGISRLTIIEMRCALARRRRANQVSPELETQVLEAFRLDMQDGALVVASFGEDDMTLAYHLMDEVGAVPLRTLDALHLAVARRITAKAFATADKNQAEAATRLGFTLHSFY
ncbi:MAG: type II toxin-antitoxin system VapC family toxin [Thiobacillaceae bacterium]